MFHVEQLINEKQEQIDFFIDELLKWQKTTNLISSDSSLSRDLIFKRHVLDSAQIISYMGIHPNNIADLGSGAGFPGVIIALLLNTRVDLYESNARKAQFLKHIAMKLHLNVRVINERIEKYQPGQLYELITSRAMTTLVNIMDLSTGKYDTNTKFILHKGKNYQAEIDALTRKFEFKLEAKSSITDNSGKILVIWGVNGKSLRNS